MALDLGKITTTLDYDLRLVPTGAPVSGVSLGTISVKGTMEEISAFARELSEGIAREMNRVQERAMRQH